MEHAHTIQRLAVAVAGFALGLGSAASASVIVDYDGGPSEDFLTAPYREAGTTTLIDAGHYEVAADPGGASGDGAFQLDEQQLGLSKVTVIADGPRFFDALSLEVVNPADTPGEYTISAIGGSGSLAAPTVAGPVALGPGFEGITGLRITQNAPGAFAFDELQVQVLPEPAALPSWLAAGLALLALRRGRKR